MKAGICKLCKQKEASSIASHIFSHFFIKSMLNPLDEEKRGYGSSYSISGSKFLDIFFEREYNADKITEVLGREITDDEIDSLTDHYAVKYILCKDCEDKMERIENHFNDNVFKIVFDKKIASKKINNNQIIHSIKDANNNIVRLFIISLIWRASITKFSGFSLKHREQEKLRVLLNKSLDLNLEELTKKAKLNEKEIRSFPLMLFSTRFFSDTTSNLVHIEKSSNPYIFKVNEYIIIFGTKQNQIKNNRNDFYGLSNIINYDESINVNEDTIKVTEIFSSDFQSIKDELFSKLGKDFINELAKIFQIIYGKFHQTNPTIETTQNFLDDFVSEDITIAEKYSIENIKKKISEHLN